jgi:hypothetical protein
MGPRFLAAIVAALCALLAGCVPSLDEQLTREGIGSELYTQDLAKQTELQEQYLGFMCQQAGVPVSDNGQGLPQCDYGDISGPGWRAVVTAGLNDIDRRCDSYLAWLDNKRRSRGPLLKQLSDTDLATRTIMTFSGADPDAINIVGVAFGLLRQSIENYHSRLLLEVESSTVNTIVLTKRNSFRNDVRSKQITNKPDAVHAIRAYLRICLPFTIETDINDLSSLQARGTAADELPSVTSSVEALPDLPPAFEPVRRATERITPTPVIPPELTPAGAETRFERQLKPSDVKFMQTALCIPSDGAFGLITRRAIRVFETVEQAEAIDGRLNDREGGLLLSKGACDREKFLNYLERDRFTAASNVEKLKRRINALLPAEGPKLAVDANFNTTETRMAIADLKSACAIENSLQLPDEEVTPEFLRRINFSRGDADPAQPCTPGLPPQ